MLKVVYSLKYNIEMILNDIAMLLINPMLYVFIALTILLVLKKKNNVLLIILTLYLYVISIPYTTNQLIARYWSVNDTYDSSGTYDAAVVMAGVTDANLYIANHFPFYVPESHVFNANSIERIWAGVYFVKNGFAKTLLFGQWTLKTYNEGEVVKKYALNLGLKEEQLYLYGPVHRTIDEAKGVKRLNSQKTFKKLLLITSDSHMRRSLAMFKKQGLTPDVFSTNKHGTHVDFLSFLPTAAALESTNMYLYEIVGYVLYYILGDL
ncbi:MAG: YdcF family protein [Nitrospirae bacterium]|nr:YdcF family protein [Nitrospirota bacterium]